jgi:hypothetical protein
MLRPATPLTILLLASFVLLLLSVISTPIVKGIPIATFQGVNFGVFGYCKGSQCSGIKIGYSTGLNTLALIMPSKLTLRYRWSLLDNRQRPGLRSAFRLSTHPLLHSYRPSRCRIAQPNMPCSGRCRAPSFALPFTALSSGPSDPSDPHASCHATRLLG